MASRDAQVRALIWLWILSAGPGEWVVPRFLAAQESETPTPEAQEAGTLTSIASVLVGLNPHQIVFSPDGSRAYVAAAGSDRVTIVDAVTHRVRSTLDVEGKPLGLAVLDGGAALAVTRFGSDRLVRVGANAGAFLDELEVGGAPSLIVGPFPDQRYLLSSERTNRLFVLDGATFSVDQSIGVGQRPFPPDATSDGTIALVPNYDDGTVTALDLTRGIPIWTTRVGVRPSGGAVLPGDTVYAVAIRGEDRVALLDIRTGLAVGEIREGIGQGPFSVVVSSELRVAFVNNTASHDISVVDLGTLDVLDRVGVPEVPIVLAIAPDAGSLWVSSEGEDVLTVLSIPEEWRAPARAPTTDQGPPETDIWVADLARASGGYEIGPVRRVTDRAGYDNQPYLLSGGDRLLYTSIDTTGQADIWRADLNTGDLQRVTTTEQESEYSAAPTPDGQGISVIRTEADGAQRLWRFDLDGTNPTLVLADVEPVGYHAWADSSRLAVFALGDPPQLQLVDLRVGTPRVVAERIGRSLHYVPGRRAVSFVQFDAAGVGSIRAVDLSTGVTVTLTQAREGSQDLAWTPEGEILMAQGSQVYHWASESGWRLIADLAEQGLVGITRLSISPEGNRLALVAAR